MYTQCPECNTYFRVTAENLRVANGEVCCGACETEFNALASLIDDIPVDIVENNDRGKIPVDIEENNDRGKIPVEIVEDNDRGDEPGTDDARDVDDPMSDKDPISDEGPIAVEDEGEGYEEIIVLESGPDDTGPEYTIDDDDAGNTDYDEDLEDPEDSENP